MMNVTLSTTNYICHVNAGISNSLTPGNISLYTNIYYSDR